MRRWRTMFSTSTIASSTRIPTTRESASSVTTLMVKPIWCMPMKAGMADIGSATADTSVARHSRRNSHTTSTASAAPSYSRCREPMYSSCAGVTKSKASVSSMSGCCSLSSSRAFCTAAPTATSLSPRLRTTSKPITGTPSSRAAERGSATVSLTRATSLRRMRRPSASESSINATSAALRTVPRVRTGCSDTPRSVRPPAASVCTMRNWRDTSATVAPSACNLSGSMATSTSRFTPPTRFTAPTPRTEISLRAISWSTNQLSASSSICGAWPAVLGLVRTV